jgi:Protein of unknown function (DUF3110)
MYILTVEGREDEGAYSVINEYGEKVLYIFEDIDDAERYAMMLEENHFPQISVVEVDGKLIVKTCEAYDYQYTIITPNDIVIPPDTDYDSI